MMKYIFFFLLNFPLLLMAQDAYKIEVKIENYTSDTLFLGNYFLDNQYLKDTAVFDGEKYVFDGKEALEQGVYLIVLPPDNNIYEIIINDDQEFKVNIDHTAEVNKMTVKGQEETKAFQEYIQLVSSIRPRGEELSGIVKNSDPKSEEHKKAQADLKALGDELEEKRNGFVRKYSGSILASLIKSGQNVEVPEFDEIEDQDERNKRRYQYYRDHYFDPYDLTDSRLLRTPFFYEKVNYYVEKLTPQTPDSIIKTLDNLLEKFEGDEDMFKYHLITFLNKYASSKIVGFDAIYVHLVNNYYAQGKAPWTDDEQLEKMIKNAKKFEPILIGKPAPRIQLVKSDGSPIDLYDVQADYTVLYFWDPDCGHCKKSIPKLVSFYEKYKNQGVEVLAVCSKLTDKVPECWETTKERGMDIWINAADPYLRSRYKQVYDVRSTPMIYILDKDKKIVSKRIGSDQLEEVIELLKQMENAQN